MVVWIMCNLKEVCCNCESSKCINCLHNWNSEYDWSEEDYFEWNGEREEPTLDELKRK